MRSIAALACAGALLLPLAAFAPARAAESAPVVTARQAEEDYARFMAQSSACNWGSPAVREVMAGQRRLTRRLAELEDPAARQVPAAAPATEPCDSQGNLAAQNRAIILTWEWLTRLELMAQLVSTEGWGKDMVTIPAPALAANQARRAEFERILVSLFTQEAVNARAEAIRQETVAVLNLACTARRTVNTVAPRVCPDIPADLAGQRPAAAIRADEAERLAAALARG